jgi:hypothetical protein
MLTKNQRVHLMAELWPNACVFQGWNENDKERRYEFFARVLGSREPHKTTLARGGHISANDFIKTDQQDDFGDVKRELLLLAAADLRQESPVRRTRLWIIRRRLAPCLHIYKAGALDTILRERFKRARQVNGIEDLSDGDLEKLIWTLEARVNAARNEAGDSHHEMCLEARVKRWKLCPKDCEHCAAEAAQERQGAVVDGAQGSAAMLVEVTEGDPF